MSIFGSHRARCALTLALLASAGFACTAEARIRKVELQVVESPTFEGRSFGKTGQYEKLRGRAYGEVDPKDPRNAVITDIRRAPLNRRGMVEYSTDVWMVRPIDPNKGNGKIFFELNNRGNILSFGTMNDAAVTGNDPTTAEQAGNGFLMNRGYTVLEVGWDASATPALDRLTINVPVAKAQGAVSIVGPSLDEFVIDTVTSSAQPLSYPVGDTDKTKASLTWRLRYADTPQPVPSADWNYGPDGKSVTLSTDFQVGLYEFVYPAKDPLIAGLGFAAIRDVGSFLRNAKADKGNPLAGQVRQIYSWGLSQPARTMHDFVYLGFNEDERGAQVFDGVLNWIGGATGIFMNYRFAQPGRTHRQHIARWYPEFDFPFANQTLTDPVTGERDGRLKRCRETDTCPLIMEVNSANEYWAKGMSVLRTNLSGNDIPDAKGVRSYLLSSHPHGGNYSPARDGSPVPLSAGICQQPRNPLAGNTVLRALLVALDKWVTKGAEPPPSEMPLRSEGTLVPALPQATLNFPAIPSVTYNGVHHTGDLFNFGPRYDEHGILTILPPQQLGSPYPVYLPKTDVDGNDVAGVRTPDIAVPIATYTGWNLRPSGDGCDASGMMIPFAATQAERESSGDPRLSIEERYPSHAAYVQKVTEAANLLVNEGFLLAEDAAAYIQAAEDSGVGTPEP